MKLNYIYAIFFSFLVGGISSYLFFYTKDDLHRNSIAENKIISKEDTINNCNTVVTDKLNLSKIEPQKECPICKKCKEKIIYVEKKECDASITKGHIEEALNNLSGSNLDDKLEAVLLIGNDDVVLTDEIIEKLEVLIEIEKDENILTILYQTLLSSDKYTNNEVDLIYKVLSRYDISAGFIETMILSLRGDKKNISDIISYVYSSNSYVNLKEDKEFLDAFLKDLLIEK